MRDKLATRDYPAPLSDARIARKFDRQMKCEVELGIARQYVENLEGEFLGYCGLNPVDDIPEIGDHVDIGWRFFPAAWGQGFATEAALAILTQLAPNIPYEVVYAYTAPDNLASQAVMARLGLNRRPELDFIIRSGDEAGWHGLVWEAKLPFRPAR